MSPLRTLFGFVTLILIFLTLLLPTLSHPAPKRQLISSQKPPCQQILVCQNVPVRPIGVKKICKKQLLCNP